MNFWEKIFDFDHDGELNCGEKANMYTTLYAQEDEKTHSSWETDCDEDYDFGYDDDYDCDDDCDDDYDDDYDCDDDGDEGYGTDCNDDYSWYDSQSENSSRNGDCTVEEDEDGNIVITMTLDLFR